MSPRRNSRQVSASGVPLTVTCLGAGPPLLLVHGSAVSGSSWGMVARLLAPTHQVHVLERRGRGGSGDDPATYSLAAELADLAAVLADTATRAAAPVHLVGHSFGGLLAALAAAADPPALAALTVYEPSLLHGDDGGWSPARLAASAALLITQNDASATELFLKEVIGQSDEQIHQLRQRAAAWTDTVALAPLTWREGGAALGAVDRIGELAAIRVPTQVLYGTDSPPRFQLAVRRFAAALPSAVLRPLAGQAHLGMLTAPELVAALIADWPNASVR